MVAKRVVLSLEEGEEAGRFFFNKKIFKMIKDNKHFLGRREKRGKRGTNSCFGRNNPGAKTMAKFAAVILF